MLFNNIKTLFRTQIVKMPIHRNLTNAKTPNRLKNKIAIVTASTDGIGLAIATRLAEDGAMVVISSRKQENVNRAVQQLSQQGLTNVIGIKCHVGLAADRQQLFRKTIEQFGGLDILVSNAAANPYFGSTLDCNEDAWDKIFDINVKASFLLAKEAVPLIRNRMGGGSITFVSSIAGYRPIQFLGPYSISKTALFGLTKVLSEELGPEGIRVNCLAPGIIYTKFSDALVNNEASKDLVVQQTSLKRIGQPDEMAGVVSFLVSDDASYITGETIVAAGGMHARL